MASASEEKITVQEATGSRGDDSQNSNMRNSQDSRAASSLSSQGSDEWQLPNYFERLKEVSAGRPDVERMCDMINDQFDVAWEAKLALVDFVRNRSPAFEELNISDTPESLKDALTRRSDDLGLRVIILCDSFREYRATNLLNLLADIFNLDPFSIWQHTAPYRGGSFLPSEMSTSPVEVVLTGGIGTASCHTDEATGQKTVVLLWDIDRQERQNPHLADETDLFCTRGFPIPSLQPSSASPASSPRSSAEGSDDNKYRSVMGRTRLAFSAMSISDANSALDHPIIALIPLLSRGLIDHSQLVHRATNLSMTMQHRYSSYRDNANFEARQSFFANGTYQKLQRCRNSLNLHMALPWFDKDHATASKVGEGLSLNIADHTCLIERVEFLRSLIEHQATRNLGLQSVEEAKLSLRHAKSVTRLTRLAFVFIPLSFATSVFGMNIHGWQEDKAPHIRSFIIVALTVTILTMLFAWLSTIWDNYRQLQVDTDKSYWSVLVSEISLKSKMLAVFFVIYSMFHTAEKTRELAQALGVEIHGAVWDGSSCDRYLDLHQADPMDRFWRRLGQPIFERWKTERKADLESNCKSEPFIL